MIINLCGLVRTQKTSKQNMSNLRGLYTDESESKRFNINEEESKRINLSKCYTDNSESKGIHEVNTSIEFFYEVRRTFS